MLHCSEEERKPVKLMKTLLTLVIILMPSEEKMRGSSFKFRYPATLIILKECV